MRWLSFSRARVISRKAAARPGVWQIIRKFRSLHFGVKAPLFQLKVQYVDCECRIPIFPRNTVETITKEGASPMKTLLRFCLFALALSGLIAGIMPKTSTAGTIPKLPTMPSCPGN